ncbi:hypothetical protein [Blastomonas sp.]|uniref:hypothetical protein n=1 Tax=Blastomonas sp. TaxID=1909299 RepID=UPI003593AE50
MHDRLIRASAKSLAIVATLAMLAPMPAAAQFGGLLRNKPSSSGKTQSGCDDSAGKSVGRSIIGGMLGSAARRMGGIASFIPTPEVAGLLTDAIACKLEPEEQKQAADATLEATRGEEVGSTSAWSSGSRQNVSGTSTVTGKTALADGSTCMDVNDVIIVEGEETKVSKRMCKRPGSPRYEIAQV